MLVLGVRSNRDRVVVTDLRGVVVKDDGVEVSTVVVLDEVLSGIGALQTACSHTLLLYKGLVQGKDHLEMRKICPLTT